MEGVAPEDILNVIEGYAGEGYGVTDGDLLGELILLLPYTHMYPFIHYINRRHYPILMAIYLYIHVQMYMYLYCVGCNM